MIVTIAILNTKVTVLKFNGSKTSKSVKVDVAAAMQSLPSARRQGYEYVDIEEFEALTGMEVA